MKLTANEKKVCKKYSEYDETCHVNCCECPLMIHPPMKDGYCMGVCYANIDGRTKEAKKLNRY